jgi:hypothetical protein
MKETKAPVSQEEERQAALSHSGRKKRWQEPKLRFVKPKLTKHGKLEEVTAGFFGQFSPGPRT